MCEKEKMKQEQIFAVVVGEKESNNFHCQCFMFVYHIFFQKKFQIFQQKISM